MINTRDLKRLDKDDILGLLGLESKRTAVDWLVPTVTAFAVGVAVGVSVGLFLAPRAEGLLGAEEDPRLAGAGHDMSAAGGRGVERMSGTR
ncbi:MAG: hypothetical protein L0Y66_27180 [Myxococcaceae bacterium]|nr:hypothetical protein [Myxococcaceae bacterium]MCI0669881.1 hypothetical protein [Myxococcaceae bacterium]